MLVSAEPDRSQYLVPVRRHQAEAELFDPSPKELNEMHREIEILPLDKPHALAKFANRYENRQRRERS